MTCLFVANEFANKLHIKSSWLLSSLPDCICCTVRDRAEFGQSKISPHIPVYVTMENTPSR